jgi:hypothetical protein
LREKAERRLTLFRLALCGGLALFLGCDTAAPIAAAQPAPSPSAPVEEFVGPFSSWANAKTTYGAIGDGTADDTAALQRGLTELGTDAHTPVLFLPAGRYRLTGTLILTGSINVSIVGEDPGSVTLIWDGPKAGTMMMVNGVAYSRFTRLTFDGRARASVAVEQSWDGKTGNFDTGNEYSDCVFTGVEYGIRGGFRGFGFAETSILRARFLHNTKAGVALGNFNALDIWIWNSLFDHCTVGVTNDPGAGNFHVYDSVFRGSALADLSMQNTGGFSARGNYSVGSKAFYVSGPPLNHPALISLQANTIVDPGDSAAIRLSNQGPGLIVDNVIRSLPGTLTSPVFWKSPYGADVVSVGNVFTVDHPVDVNGRYHSIEDRVVSRASLRPVEPSLPGALPNLTREVFDVPSGADAARIQAVITAAAEKIGHRPVVHFPFGRFSISSTLTVPPGDVQLVGDGFGTRLVWTGEEGGTVMRLDGPTHATLRELLVDGNGKADGIHVEAIDQPGARVHLSGLQLRAGRQTGLFVDGLEHAIVDLIDVGHAYEPSGASVKMVGARATIFSGASSGNYVSYDIADGAALVARDIWYEGNAPGGFARIHGRAAFTMEASRVAIPANTPAATFTVTDLDGRASLLTTLFDNRIVFDGDGHRAELLGLGLVREFQPSPYFTSETVPAGHALLLNTRQRARTQGALSPGTEALPDIGTFDPAFVLRLLADTRRVVSPTPLLPLPEKTTDLRMFRVWSENGMNNLVLRGR